MRDGYLYFFPRTFLSLINGLENHKLRRHLRRTFDMLTTRITSSSSSVTCLSCAVLPLSDSEQPELTISHILDTIAANRTTGLVAVLAAANRRLEMNTLNFGLRTSKDNERVAQT
jgi:hypothetical protein